MRQTTRKVKKPVRRRKKTAAEAFPMTKRTTANDMFLLIKRFMQSKNVHYNQKGKLYYVLAGIRGPDEYKHHGPHKTDAGYITIKGATTAVIRHHLFGGRIGFGPMVAPDSLAGRELRAKLDYPKYGHDHFMSHARKAFRDLGLSWDMKNGVD